MNPYPGRRPDTARENIDRCPNVCGRWRRNLDTVRIFESTAAVFCRQKSLCRSFAPCRPRLLLWLPCGSEPDAPAVFFTLQPLQYVAPYNPHAGLAERGAPAEVRRGVPRAVHRTSVQDGSRDARRDRFSAEAWPARFQPAAALGTARFVEGGERVSKCRSTVGPRGRPCPARRRGLVKVFVGGITIARAASPGSCPELSTSSQTPSASRSPCDVPFRGHRFSSS